MLGYFALRATNREADAEHKAWLDSELQNGSLRQGWLDEVGLVDAHAGLVRREDWMKQARAAIRRWDWPSEAQKRRYWSAKFCPEKYDELRLMTEVQEADVIVVLGLFEKRNNREGFKIAIAKRAPSRKARRRNCYWYEANGKCGHILSVDYVTPEVQYDFVWEKYAKPVQRIRKNDLIKALEAIRARVLPPLAAELPRFELNDEERKKIERQIADRQGQPEFRRKLLSAYGKKCAISGCDVEQVLEAAHIIPHSESATDDERNGILLRADLHTLLDNGFLSIKPSTRTVQLHPDLRKTAYREFEGRKIAKANPANRRPDPGVLRRHFALFQQVTR